jgi:uncharacterized protein YbjT (DUF2867 family)
MILVTGATGNVGRPTVRTLLERGAEVRVFTRDRSRLGDIADKVDVVLGDFADESALRAAMRGIEKMYLHAVGGGNEEVSAAITAARAEDVAHIVHLSSLSASLPGPTAAQWFLAREALIKDAGFRWTMLRGGFFMSNVLRSVPAIRDGKVVRGLAGRFAPIDTRDVGAVAAAALTEPGHEGKAYDLTGPELMDAREQFAILADVIGRPIAFEEMSPEDVIAEARATGAPEDRIAFARAVAEGLAAGQWPVVTDAVEQVTGRKPGTFRQWCIDNSRAFDPVDRPESPLAEA